MKIGEIVAHLANKTMSRPEIAKQYDISSRTFSTKLKRVGYDWDYSKKIHVFNGTPEEKAKADDIDFSTLIHLYNQDKSKSPKTQKKAPKSPSKTLEDNLPKDKPESNTEAVQAPKAEQTELDFSRMDNLDVLINQERPDKAYKGFYLDNDVIKALEKVPDGNKSKLVNEALRIVFKAKGLL